MGFFNRRHQPELTYGLDRAEMSQLATYNSEAARGIIHTVAWKHQMRELQQRYDPGIIWVGEP